MNIGLFGKTSICRCQLEIIFYTIKNILPVAFGQNVGVTIAGNNVEEHKLHIAVDGIRYTNYTHFSDE